MRAACILCKGAFEVPAEVVDRPCLVVCPHCGFLGTWQQHELAVPTHAEELSLERVQGEVPGAGTPAGEDDVTVVDGPAVPVAAPWRRKLFLRIVSGANQGTVFEVKGGRAVIGRRDADLVLDDPKLSRKHAVIEAISRENIFVRDLASTNGTYVSGIAIRQRKLLPGDVIRVGSTDLEFYWEDEPDT